MAAPCRGAQGAVSAAPEAGGVGGVQSHEVLRQRLQEVFLPRGAVLPHRPIIGAWSQVPIAGMRTRVKPHNDMTPFAVPKD